MSNRIHELMFLMAYCALVCVAFFGATGCQSASKLFLQDEAGDDVPLAPPLQIREAVPVDSIHQKIESSKTPSFTTEQSEFAQPAAQPAIGFGQPRTSTEGLPTSFRELTLHQAIAIGLQDTRVLRQLNAQVLVNPGSVSSSLDAAIADSNPNFGSAAALAAFDAITSSSLSYANNDDVFNNVFLGGGASEVRQKLTTADWRATRTTTNGTQLSLSSQIQHDFNNGPSNVFDHSWRTLIEASVRKPLLQGSGNDFNLIAGPNAQPGFRFSTGIKISQINDEITKADFQREIQNYVASVTNAYWEMYFSYRDFAVAQKARDVAYETWKSVESRFESGLPGGEADAEAQAREQYYEFQLRVTEALSGNRGVLQAEANLRRLIGLPQSDQDFLRPVDTPLQAKVAYQWEALVGEALGSRIELRQQSAKIRRREMELVAARNFMRPRLDAVGTYRNNGFGDDLTGGGGGRFSSAAKDAVNFEHDEWEFGLQYNVPIGFRQARSAVRHAELNLQRERIVFEEQGKQISHDLGTAYREMDRAWNSMQYAQARFEAAEGTFKARTASYDEDLSTIVDLLEAQRRLGRAESELYRARADYTSANFEVLRESGRLLQDFAIHVEPQPNCGGTECAHRVTPFVFHF